MAIGELPLVFLANCACHKLMIPGILPVCHQTWLWDQSVRVVWLIAEGMSDLIFSYLSSPSPLKCSVGIWFFVFPYSFDNGYFQFVWRVAPGPHKRSLMMLILLVV